MAVQAVCCISCGMYVVRESSSVSGDFTCKKCVRLRLLEERVKELEVELEELRIIREAEVDIDRSYKEIVTPRNQSWVTARRRGKKQVGGQSPGAVPLQNRFSVLEATVEEESTGDSQREQVSGDESIVKAQVFRGCKRLGLVIGDSTVRGTDRRVGSNGRDSAGVLPTRGWGPGCIGEDIQDSQG